MQRPKRCYEKFKAPTAIIAAGCFLFAFAVLGNHSRPIAFIEYSNDKLNKGPASEKHEISLPSNNETTGKHHKEFDRFWSNLTTSMKEKNLLQSGNMSIIGHQWPKKGFLTIGIPTVYRRHAGSKYLLSTLQAIIDKTTEDEKQEVVVLIFTADFNDTYRKEVITNVRKYYSAYMKSGFIQILLVSEGSYPPLENLKRNYNDAPIRVKWRSKQVADFAFMFYHGRNLSEYFLQIEDDVICAKEFVKHIRNFIKSQTKPWVIMEFSYLGFIGKLFKSGDLKIFSRFLLLFYQEMPVDFLFRYFAQLLTYPKIPQRLPSLFQHIGEHSSLSIKDLNRLKDTSFADRGPLNIPIPRPVPERQNTKPTNSSQI